MHELSIALSIIDIAAEESERQRTGSNGTPAVRAIHVRMGPLSGVVKEALVSAYDLAREGTVLADAELVIEDVPVTAFCQSCQQQRNIASIQDLFCPQCGTPCSEVVTGRELEIVAMEFEQ